MGFQSYLLMVYLSIYLTGCGAAQDAQQSAIDVIVTNSKSIRDISLGMTKKELEALDYKLSWTTRQEEGDTYEIVEIQIDPHKNLIGVFDLNGSLSSFEIYSPEWVTDAGIRLGSSLSDVMNLLPQGRLITGFADGNYANFITEGDIVYSFDPDMFPAGCFDFPNDCKPTYDERVILITIG